MLACHCCRVVGCGGLNYYDLIGRGVVAVLIYRLLASIVIIFRCVAFVLDREQLVGEQQNFIKISFFIFSLSHFFRPVMTKS
jgi:hypothetical protein